MNISNEYQKAFKLIESWRYKYDVSEAVKLFVAQWAYQCTGLYKPQSSIVNDSIFNDVAKPLSHVLASMMLKGVSDPIATILSEFCKADSKYQGYYPTPPQVGNLLSQLLAASNSRSQLPRLKVYEPCCGSAGIIMQKIEHLFNANLDKSEPLGHVDIVVEDVNATAIHAFCIQLIFKINYLSLVSGKKAEPNRVEINQIDVISRKSGSIYYLFERYE